MSGLAEILQENQRLRSSLVEREARLTSLQQVVAERERSLSEQAEALQLLTEQRDAVQRRAEQLAEELEFLKLQRRGAVSQRFVPGDEQGILPMFADVQAPPRHPKADDESDDDGEDEKGKRKRKPSRKGTSRRNREAFNHLPSRKVHCPAAADAACAKCGGNLRVIGQAESFRINWVPGHYVVEDIARDKCACPNCPSEGVLTVPSPHALDRALCGDALLARVLIDKFADHIPLHRQARRMAREGFDVSTNTLSSWVVQAHDRLLRRIADAVMQDILENRFAQSDDTGFPVQDRGDGKLRKGRMWAVTDQQQVGYAFTDTKEGKFPAEILAKFKGDCLLVDAGSEFNLVVSKLDLLRAGCWSHLRTYFVYALQFHPYEARVALGTIRDIFMLERTFRDLPADERLAGRRQHSLVLVDGLMAWVKKLSPMVRPKTKLMEALTYATNQEATLRVFLERGDIPIHNNLSELMLRQHVVGRKNWLFARSEGGARAASTMFTLIGSCWLQGVNPHEYFVDVLGRVLDHPASRIRELTPRAWLLAKDGTGAPG